MIESSRIILDEESLLNNINFLKRKLGNKVKISSVLKANAYGHGIEEIAPLFEKAGIDHFSVFDYNEAERVHDSILLPSSTIMIMGWISEKDMKNAISKGFEFYIFNVERLTMALQFAEELKIKAKIHIEVETGMNRSGLDIAELEEVVKIINDNIKYFEIQGFCTHLAGAESISNHLRIQKQIKKYNKLYNEFLKFGITPKYRHIANSAAAFVYPKTRLDLVRIGIMQYGYWSSNETFIQYLYNKVNKTNPLKRILSWDSKIMSIKEIKMGEYIGYGISFLAHTDLKTALIPVGYACGYSRSLSNKGRVLIGGQFCNVIGMVNMNMIIVDISNVVEAKVGDEVVIIGKQKDLEIKVSSFGEISNELNYEVLTHLSEKINRTIINI